MGVQFLEDRGLLPSNVACSVLGPLLFLIYINDLAQILRDISRPVLFADDTSIIISNRDKQEFKNNLESVMDIAINWFQNNIVHEL